MDNGELSTFISSNVNLPRGADFVSRCLLPDSGSLGNGFQRIHSLLAFQKAVPLRLRISILCKGFPFDLLNVRRSSYETQDGGQSAASIRGRLVENVEDPLASFD